MLSKSNQLEYHNLTPSQSLTVLIASVVGSLDLFLILHGLTPDIVIDVVFVGFGAIIILHVVLILAWIYVWYVEKHQAEAGSLH